MSDTRDGKLIVALLALPESTASTLYGMYEVLESAGRDWGYLTEGVPGEPLFRPLIVTAGGTGFRAANGLWIEPSCRLEQCPAPHVVAIPDLMVLPGEDLSGRYDREIEWLDGQNEAGAVFATACTGALILAEAGLLDGHDATIHWAYCDAMQQCYPKVRVQANRALVTSGDGQRFLMAGGGTSWHDLALFLIARFAGTDEAMRVARLHLFEWHHVGQQPFAALTRTRQSGDAVIARCQEWIAGHYDQDSPVAAMARLSGLAERSFKRRFANATGMSPLEYVQALRLEETKHMLETTDWPVDRIANEVGYEDASFFGRLFRRNVGLTPAQYRKRFKSLRHALEQGGTGTRRLPPAPRTGSPDGSAAEVR